MFAHPNSREATPCELPSLSPSSMEFPSSLCGHTSHPPFGGLSTLLSFPDVSGAMKTKREQSLLGPLLWGEQGPGSAAPLRLVLPCAVCAICCHTWSPAAFPLLHKGPTNLTIYEEPGCRELTPCICFGFPQRGHQLGHPECLGLGVSPVSMPCLERHPRSPPHLLSTFSACLSVRICG